MVWNSALKEMRAERRDADGRVLKGTLRGTAGTSRWRREGAAGARDMER